MATGKIRYWAAARVAAGTDEEEFRAAATLSDVLREAAAMHGPQLERVLSASSFLVDGVRRGPATRLDDGDVIEVLPPFAGG